MFGYLRKYYLLKINLNKRTTATRGSRSFNQIIKFTDIEFCFIGGAGSGTTKGLYKLFIGMFKGCAIVLFTTALEDLKPFFLALIFLVRPFIIFKPEDKNGNII